jgi:hypothetical protein
MVLMMFVKVVGMEKFCGGGSKVGEAKPKCNRGGMEQRPEVRKVKHRDQMLDAFHTRCV